MKPWKISGAPTNSFQLSVLLYSLALSKKRRLDSECRSVMKVGKDWGNGEVAIYRWVRFQGLPPEAGGLAPQGLDPGHHQLFPTEAINSITASNL